MAERTGDTAATEPCRVPCHPAPPDLECTADLVGSLSQVPPQLVDKANELDAPPPPALPPLAAKANDLDALRSAVVDAASVGAGLWLSYLFVLFYLLIAAGGVTHEDLFFETPVKLPFLSVDLPLKGFFVLGPLLFLIVHAYVLLHFGMLSNKVRAFDRVLREQIEDADIRTQLRRQLPSNVFVQFLAGPTEVRDGLMGFFLWLTAMISLVVGPVCLLVFMQLQFLPYHSEGITWWQRIAVGFDLVLIWLFWPSIAQLDQKLPAPAGARRVMVRAERALTWCIMWVLSGGVTLLVMMFATYPGEHIDTLLWQPGGFLQRSYKAAGEVKQASAARKWFIEQVRWGGLPEVWRALGAAREFLVAGQVNPASRTPESLWSNRLVLPGLDVAAHLKLDSKAKLDFLSETASLRNRNLDGAVLIGAILPKVDFTGASLQLALLDFADLRSSKLLCADWYGTKREPICAQLQGASLLQAQLQGASLERAQLQGVRLDRAQLQGASLDRAQLQGVSLFLAQLQGVSLFQAQLQGASLDEAQLQGAFFLQAELKGASLFEAQLQGADLDEARLQFASLKGAMLQGASLRYAQLQGAWLDDAHLQAASLEDAQLQGASLDRAQLQGASLNEAQLQGASLEGVCTWRTDARTAAADLALIKADQDCIWRPGDFDEIKHLISESFRRDDAREVALDHIDRLTNPEKPLDKEQDMADWWKKRSGRPPPIDYERAVFTAWRDAGCAAVGAPYVISRLVRRFRYHDSVYFKEGSPQPSNLAREFLKPTCEGARGLAADDTALLKELASRNAAPPAPAAE
jgi:uncharacterized protein YjbI with pentapeptide repeats